MRFWKKPYFWAAAYSVILISFTLYVALDTFVIPRVYSVVDKTTVSVSRTKSDGTAGNISNTSTASTGNDAVVTDGSYTDGNVSITINEYREYNTDIYVADIYLSSADCLKTAFAGNIFGRNITEKTSVMAEEQNAVLAINGDFYGAQRNGYVIRNGVIYRDSSSDPGQEDLVVYSDGSFGIITEGSTTASELLSKGALQVFSFGPGLISDGEITVTSHDEVDRAMVNNPRTAIGIIDNLHYVMIVSDGRTNASTGLTLYELADFMKGLGVTTAYNLDGGGSSTMYFNGAVINNPTTDGRRISERSVSDIVFIG